MTPQALALACGGFAAILFLVAFLADRRSQKGSALGGPVTYTLSLSVYCTAWTFYGAVGNAARSGLEFMTIYLGPTLVFVGWWWILRRLVAIGRAERITSIADLISSRFGKSPGLAALVTGIAVVATTPYIALQLQSIATSFRVTAGLADATDPALAFGVAAGLALFAILFGTRRLDAAERHDGIVAAVAFEAVVKLVALLAVGGFVVWGLNGGVAASAASVAASDLADWSAGPGRWAALLIVSAAAVLCLPRMFHVMVVENRDPRHLDTAAWAFPLYMAAMCLFVVPIAATGLERLPAGANPDLFVLTIPLAEGRDGLALLAFLGGFSSATSMVVVASVALATMLSNHVVMPLWLASKGRGGATMSGDMRRAALRARRGAILGILAMGWLYYRATGGGAALAAIGLVAFVGIAQVLPALLAALFWTRATRAGAACGIVAGAAIWGWTMLLPVVGGAGAAGLVAEGPFGLGWFAPSTPLGLDGDPLVVTVALSLGLNAALLCAVSLMSDPTVMERLQAARFVHVLDRAAPPRPRAMAAGTGDLLVMAQRLLGYRESAALFDRHATVQDRPDGPPEATAELLDDLERRLAGSVGAATAHAMVAGITGESAVTMTDLMAVADEAALVQSQAARLRAKSEALRRTTTDLRTANAELTRLAAQKDVFLSQVSHELRTPMTSVQSFSEILMEPGLPDEARARYAAIVHDESRRLTRLLDDLLDLTVLETGGVALTLETVRLSDVIDRAVAAATAAGAGCLTVARDRRREEVAVCTDPDRLAQVLINIVGNASKYCDAPAPRLDIAVTTGATAVHVDLEDNGSGIASGDRAAAFDAFTRFAVAGGGGRARGGAGLGLAISRQLMARLGGSVVYLDGRPGGAFRVTVPTSPAAMPRTAG